jgi:hypothetical protein
MAVFSLEKGCFCYPDDRQQALCPQHYVKATPIGKMELVQVLDPALWEWFLSTQRGGG